MFLVVPADERGKADDKTKDPSRSNQHLSAFRGHDVRISNRVSDCDVSVQTYDNLELIDAEWSGSKMLSNRPERYHKMCQGLVQRSSSVDLDRFLHSFGLS